MSARAAVAAAGLSLRLHARTAALVAVVTALALVGTVPVLALLGDAAEPALAARVPDLAALRASWSGGVPWPVLVQVTQAQLGGIVRGAAACTLAVALLTLVALHVARAGARHGDVLVARSVGASRATLARAALLEAGALLVVACAAAAPLALAAGIALRATWPGSLAAGWAWQGAGAALAIAAGVLAAPLLLARALATTRLVDDDRRPLALVVPAVQLGAALAVLAGARTVARMVPQGDALAAAGGAPRTLDVLTLDDGDGDRAARARRLAAALDAAHRVPGARLALATPGTLLGLGTSADAVTDCGVCAMGNIGGVRYLVVPVAHHVVSGDTFAVAGLAPLAGRLLDGRDRWDAPLAAVVSAGVARRFFERGDAVGRRIRLDLLGGRWFTVVGVVPDVPPRTAGAAMQAPFAVYVSVLQHPVARLEAAYVPGGAGDARDAAALLRPIAPVVQRDALGVREARLRAPLPWFARLLVAQGLAAALIALGGTLVLLRLWLDAQRRELGVRRAVGAPARAIVAMVLGRAARVAGAGVALGAWGGLVAWDVLPRVLPGAPAFDARAVAETGAVLAAAVLAVAWWTAARVVRTPPVTLLSAEG